MVDPEKIKSRAVADTSLGAWVAHLPRGVGHIPAFGTGPMLLATADLLLLCLLRTPLRASGDMLVLGAILWAIATPCPDVLVSGDGETVCLRGANGKRWILQSSHGGFALNAWLAADADRRPIKDASLHDSVRCDAIGCIGRFADGELVSYLKSAEAFAEDCRRATLVISRRDAQVACAATLINSKVWGARGYRTALERKPFHRDCRPSVRL